MTPFRIMLRAYFHSLPLLCAILCCVTAMQIVDPLQLDVNTQTIIDCLACASLDETSHNEANLFLQLMSSPVEVVRPAGTT